MKSKIKNLLIALAFCPLSALNAQTEVMAWGNITGYRIDGELIEFETSLRVGEPNKGNMEITGKEKQSYPIYHRDGNIQKVTTLMKGIQLHQTVEELQDFYVKAMKHIQDALQEGWKKKDAVDLALYEAG